ncbi:LysR substrate-binding domain-containing protein [Stenotrophomonas sp.]|uniref:LysR substrate-binding domain-containing protein n=1 Tax=Stenotrophomonas sp. TaxID=69392 RepID=UPI002FC87756
MDTLRCMQAFVAVVEHGSFNAAAVQLDVSSVMVGKYIQQLEAHLGVRLLQRNTRRQALTDAGRNYLAGCRTVLEQVQQAEASVEGLQAQPRGVLRVSAPVTWGSCVLAPLVAQYLAAHPQVTVELDLSNRRVDLIEESFDAVIRMGALGSAEWVARPLPPYAMQICAAPAYLQRRGIPRHPADLAAHDCLTHLAWRGGHGWRLRGHPGQDWSEHSRLLCNDGDGLRRAALAGAGLILQPAVLLAEDIAAGRLQPVLADYLPEPRPLHLVYLPDRRPRPKLSSFVDFLLGHLTPG